MTRLTRERRNNLRKVAGPELTALLDDSDALDAVTAERDRLRLELADEQTYREIARQSRIKYDEAIGGGVEIRSADHALKLARETRKERDALAAKLAAAEARETALRAVYDQACIVADPYLDMDDVGLDELRAAIASVKP